MPCSSEPCRPLRAFTFPSNSGNLWAISAGPFSGGCRSKHSKHDEDLGFSMNTDDIIIRCLNCGTKNRIPRTRFKENPVCGRCHAKLDDMIIRCLNCGTKNRMPENRLNAHPLCGRCGAPLVVESGLYTPVEVTDSTFLGEVLTSNRSVLVDCWAPWCGPCRSLASHLEELAAKYGGGIKIAKLNVDENPLTAQQYNVRNIPTMLLFSKGRLVNTLVGLLSKEEIERHLLSIMETS